MKKLLLLILLFNCGIGISQTEFPFYEQLAFNFYQTTIIDSFPQKKKVKIYPYAVNFHPSNIKFHVPICLGINWQNNEQFKELDFYTETQLNIDSDRFELNLSKVDKNKFKIKKHGKITYPLLQITPPNIKVNGKDRVFVNISITNESSSETYYLEFNNKGEIINWCRSYEKVIQIH